MTNIWKHTTKYTWLALVSLLIINTAGLFAMRWAGNQKDISDRQKYIEKAELASISISADQIQLLTVSLPKESTPAYQAIKDLLVRFQKINPTSRLSLLGKAGDQIVTLVDSSTTTSLSKNAYPQASPELDGVFTKGQSTIQSGSGWVSALVPIRNSESGQVIAVLELDIPVEEWRMHIAYAQSVPFLIALFLSILVLLPISLHQRSELIQQELQKQVAARTETETTSRKQFSENLAMMLLIDPKSGNIVEANRAAQSFYQYTREELLNMSIFDINVYPECLVREMIALVEENGGAYFTFQHRLADGSIRDIETNVSLIQMGSQKVLLSMIHDITERIKNEHELRKLSRAVEYSPVSIVITDSDANIQYVNPKFNTVTGYSSDEVIGKNPRVLNSGDTPRETYASLWQTITSGGVWTGIFHNRKKNGETYRESATIAPIMDEFGITTHYLAIKEDITQRIQAEQALKDQILKAEIDNLAKGEFLANMSHELRTPLNGVVGMTRLLLQTDLTSEQRQYAEIIYSSGEALLPLIQDILDFSKIEANRVELENVNFDLTEMIEETMDLFSVQAQEKGIGLDLKIAPAVPRQLRGDPERLRRVIINLVGNAIKFTSQGEVSITVQQESETDEDTVLRVSVRDTGVGIPQDRIPHLFNPFIQGSPAITRKYGGTGLGLAISKQLVELMAGQIHVESKEDIGSTFWFTAAIKKQNPCTQSIDGGNVKLKARSKDRFITPTTDGQSTPLVSQRTKEMKNVRILLVEDNPINQQVGELTLRKLGYSVDLAANGREALQVLCKNSYDLVLMDCQMPEMDGFTASAAIRASDPATLNPQIPIIAMTAYALDEDRDLCLAAGMNDYLSKPVHPGELSTKLEYWIHNSSNEPHSQPEKSAGPEAQPASDEKREDLMSDQAIIFNEPELLNRLMGDRDLAKTILAAFIKETPKQIAALKQEIISKDAANARLHAHSIRGSSANMGAENLREAAHQAEIMGQRNDLEGMEVFFPNIQRAFEQFEETIQKRNGSLALEGTNNEKSDSRR